jgi:hypothetical protein
MKYFFIFEDQGIKKGKLCNFKYSQETRFVQKIYCKNSMALYVWPSQKIKNKNLCVMVFLEVFKQACELFCAWLRILDQETNAR